MQQKLQQLSKAQLLQVLSALETAVGADAISQAVEGVIAAGKAANEEAKQERQPHEKQGKKTKKRKTIDFSKYRHRHIAFHVAYDGKKFSGFAAQGDEVEDTVEKHLFHAFTKTCLIEDRQSSGYSRCGRTDKGVSAMAQVIALRVRSNIPKDAEFVPHHPCDTVAVTVPRNVAKTMDGVKIVETEMVTEQRREYDYCSMLNAVLPPEIRVLGWTEVSDDFSARFSASYRGYRYFFVRRNLDVARMNEAAQRLIGDHDFRNFCKMDILNVSNFRREIFSAEIRVFEQHPEDDAYSVYMLQIRGVAFLWHMVRCIMAVLLAVGQGVEAPSVVDELLDVERNPCKPHYAMADDAGLVLNESGFDRLEMLYDPEQLWRLTMHYEEVFCAQMVEASRTLNAIRHLEDMTVRVVDLDALMDKTGEDVHKAKKSRDHGERSSSHTDTIGWKAAVMALKERGCKIGERHQNYTPLMQRAKAPAYEDRVQDLSSAKKREIMERHQQLKEEGVTDTASFFSAKRKAGSLHLEG